MSIKEVMQQYTAELTQTALDAIEAFKEKNTPEKMYKETQERLEKAKGEIIRKLLGFDKDSWGKDTWKLDHCNGRAGDSTAGNYIKQAQSKAVNDWLSQVDLKSIGITESMQQSMVAEYQGLFKFKFKKQIEDHANTHAAQLFEELKNSDAFDNVLNMNELLDK